MTVRDYVITITDGTTTKTLTSTPFALYDYMPRAPNPNRVTSRNALASVGETCIVRVIDGSVANNLAEIRAIQTLLDQGERAQTDPALARVYVTLKTASGATEYRSEILRGMVEYNERTFGFAAWANDVFLVRFHWSRTWYFEATTAVQVEVSNHLVTNDTTGAPVHNPRIRTKGTGISFTAATKTIADTNNDLANFKTGDTIYVRDSSSNDGTYTVATGGVAGSIVTNEALVNEAAGSNVAIIGALNNYLEIAAAQVDTVVPAPVRIELTNNAGATITYEDLHVGISHMNNITNMVWTLEAEDGNEGSNTNDDEASGGIYRALTWAGDAETEIWTYALTPAMLAAARGDYFLPLVRLQGGTIATSISLRANLKLANTTVYEGALVTLTADDYLQPLGAIQLPPNMDRLTTPKALTLSLRAKKTGGGTINLDMIQLIPLPVYRFLRQLSYGVPDANTIFIDELFSKRGIVYAGDSASGYYRSWIERGDRLVLYPSVKQRIYFLHDESDNTSNIGREFTAKVYWRPRRLSL